MKKNLIFLFFVFYLNSNVQSQTTNNTILYKKPPKWSLLLGINFGGYAGVNTQMTYYIKEKYSVSINAWQVFRDSNNTPSDYYFQGFFSKETSYSVGEKLLSLGLTGGYLIQIPKTRSRIHLQTGIYYNTLEYPDDFKRKDSDGGIFGVNLTNTNYTYTMYRKHYLSLVVAPAFEFPVFNHLGLRLQPKILAGFEEINMMMNIAINIGNATSKPLRKKKNKSD